MKKTIQAAKPYKKKNGSWDLKSFTEEVEIPDLGRPQIECNVCGWPDYPACREWCRNARLDREKEANSNSNN